MRFGSAAAITALGCASHQAWSRLTRPDAEPPQWSRLAPSVQPRRVWLAVSGGVLLVRTRWLGRVEETLSIDKWCEDIIIQTCIVVFDAWHEREADDSSD